MQSVLIIDDEKYICNLICHLIDWKALDLECIGALTDIDVAYQNRYTKMSRYYCY